MATKDAGSGSAGAGLEHEVDSRECWCLPEVLQPCPECDADEDCWRCAGRGLVEAYDEDRDCVIRHRER